VSHHRCCDCGGGGGDDCCVCGLCYFDGGPVPFSAVVTVTGGGVDSGCCAAFGPEAGQCLESELAVAIESLVFDDGEISAGPCGLAAHNETATYEAEFCDCDGDCQPGIVSEVLRIRSAVTGPTCPGFYLPTAGALVDLSVPDQDGKQYPGIVVWGGSRCLGPLVMASCEREVLVNPGGTGARAERRLRIFVVAGAGGGVAFIAMMDSPCELWPCEGGCLVWEYPHRIAGGGTTSGGFDCDGSFDPAGSFSAAYPGACETEISDSCPESSLCTETGDFAVAFDFAVSTHFGGLMAQCPPSPERDGGGLGGDDPDDPADQVIVPAAWLSEFPDLRRAVDAIRASLGPGTDQAPPPRPVGPDRRGPGDYF